MKIILSIFEYVSLKLTTPTRLSTEYKILLLVLSLGGILLSLLSTSLYGAGLSPDSVYYISAARNIAGGNGVTSFDSTPFILWPPLYPMLLAIPALIFNLDPLASAPIINAILFGFIVYFAGLLLSRHLFSSVVFALLGGAVILFSLILQDIATMAWSETLFIFLALVFLVYLEKFLVKKDRTSFIILSLAVSLACLTRYIGISLILTGLVALFFFFRENLRVKLYFIIIFIFISVIPIGIWVTRNYLISGTLFGERNPSVLTFSQNIGFTCNILLNWGYFPPKGLSERRVFLIIIIALTCFFAVFIGKANLSRLRTHLIQVGPIALYILFYISFLLYSSTTYAFEQINWRYLSPIYVPATILLLFYFEVLLEPFREHISLLIVNGVQVLVIIIWLFCYPIKGTKKYTSIWMKWGTGGYSQREWRESELIRYLQQHRIETGHLVFSNEPIALYILANIKCQKSIVNIIPYSKDSEITTTKSGSTWLNDDYDYFIWFNKVNPQDYPYSKDELQKSANVRNIIQLKDGVVFSVQRSP